uniref:Invertebrate defensins family profile domain-containing protein n=1 Tax=Anopheles atroparvus TaxID=41427 RepID=A0AAG5CTQ6_ANOAO
MEIFKINCFFCLLVLFVFMLEVQTEGCIKNIACVLRCVLRKGQQGACVDGICVCGITNG